MQPGDGTFKGKIKNVESLVKIKDPQMYKAVKQAISRYHAVLGVRQREVKLATLPSGTLGVHVTDVASGKSEGIYLNKKHFNSGKKSVEAVERKGYASGWSTKTNSPATHTVTHELAHATWNDHLKGANQVAAGREIRKMYDAWSKDNKKTGYGKYSHTNINEFWAECTAKAVHGTADKYTRKLKQICKKYKL